MQQTYLRMLIVAIPVLGTLLQCMEVQLFVPTEHKLQLLRLK